MFTNIVTHGLLYFLALFVFLFIIYVIHVSIKKYAVRLTDFEIWIILAAIWLNPDDCSRANGKNSFTPSNAILPLTNAITILERCGLHNDTRYFKYYNLLRTALLTLNSSSEWGYTKMYFSSKDILHKLVKVEYAWSDDGFYKYIPIIPDGLLKDIRIREKRLCHHDNYTNPVST